MSKMIEMEEDDKRKIIRGKFGTRNIQIMGVLEREMEIKYKNLTELIKEIIKKNFQICKTVLLKELIRFPA